MSVTEWVWIPGYEGKYKVSTEGEVKSIVREGRTTEKVLKKAITQNQDVVCLRADGGQSVRYVAHIVLEAFSGPKPDFASRVVHLDDDNRNNNFKNLAYTVKARKGLYIPGAK